MDDQAELEYCAEIENLTDGACKLRATQRYKDIMNRVEYAITKGGGCPEYYLELLADCIQLFTNIKNQVLMIHIFIMDRYKNHLSGLVDTTDPNYLSSLSRALRDYAAQNALSEPSMKTVLLQKTIIACDEAVSLEPDGRLFHVTLMESTAPNLSALVGGVVAAKLIVKAGGLPVLAKMDPHDVLSLGAGRKDRSIGCLKETAIYQDVGEGARTELARCAATAAAADCKGSDPTGRIGKCLRKMIAKMEQTSKLRLSMVKKMKETKAREGELSKMMSSMGFGGNDDMECDNRRAAAGASMLGPKVAAGKFKRQQHGNRSSKGAMY